LLLRQQQKITLLGINPTIAFENNAVSLAVAQEMAKGTMQLFKCDWSGRETN
jgi:nicotinamide mononucleotide (NMN) deamidase PncC